MLLLGITKEERYVWLQNLLNFIGLQEKEVSFNKEHLTFMLKGDQSELVESIVDNVNSLLAKANDIEEITISKKT